MATSMERARVDDDLGGLDVGASRLPPAVPQKLPAEIGLVLAEWPRAVALLPVLFHHAVAGALRTLPRAFAEINGIAVIDPHRAGGAHAAITVVAPEEGLLGRADRTHLEPPTHA